LTRPKERLSPSGARPTRNATVDPIKMAQSPKPLYQPTTLNSQIYLCLPATPPTPNVSFVPVPNGIIHQPPSLVGAPYITTDHHICPSYYYTANAIQPYSCCDSNPPFSTGAPALRSPSPISVRVPLCVVFLLTERSLYLAIYRVTLLYPLGNDIATA